MIERLILLAAPISALFGAAACVAATVYLAVERCSGSCTGFLEGMNRTPSLSVSGTIIAGVVLLLACLGRWGRWFAIGFVAAFVAVGVETSGGWLFLWGVRDPRVARSPVAASTGRRIERLNELGARPLDDQVGGRLIYRVLECVADRRPSLPTEIAAGSCKDLMTSWDGYTGPERLSDADSGWRWVYTKTTAGFQVAVYPDVMLNQPTPEFAADETGRATIRRGGGAPSVDYPRPR